MMEVDQVVPEFWKGDLVKIPVEPPVDPRDSEHPGDEDADDEQYVYWAGRSDGVSYVERSDRYVVKLGGFMEIHYRK